MVPCWVLGVLLYGDGAGGVVFRRPSLQIVVDGVGGDGVVVLDVVGSEAEETDVGDSEKFQVAPEAEETDVADSGGSRTGRAGAGCWVLWAMRARVWVRASGVCAHSPWCPVCVPVLVLWVVSCVVLGGVMGLSWPCG